MHKEELKHLHPQLLRDDVELSELHSATFSCWFEKKVETIIFYFIRTIKHLICTLFSIVIVYNVIYIQVKDERNISDVSEIIKWLSYGPRLQVVSYTGYIINGRRFHTKDYEKSTQNSGVSIEANTVRADGSVEKITYYGILRDILMLDYRLFQVVLFKCDWANIYRGVKVEDGFTLVNLHQFQNQFASDPFILATQAVQVFFSRESSSSNWYVVLKAPPRGFHELEKYEEEENSTSKPLDESLLNDRDVDNGDESYIRKDCDGILV